MRKARKVDPEKEKHWRDVFKRFQKSGLPFKKFCAAEKLSPNTFQYWRAELRARDQKRGKISEISKGENRPSDLANKIKYWTQIIQDLHAYTGSARSFCKERGISSGNLHYWTTRLNNTRSADDLAPSGQSRESDDFVPLHMVDDKTSESGEIVRQVGSLPASDQIQFTLPDGTTVAAPAHVPVDILLTLINGFVQAVSDNNRESQVYCLSENKCSIYHLLHASSYAQNRSTCAAVLTDYLD